MTISLILVLLTAFLLMVFIISGILTMKDDDITPTDDEMDEAYQDGQLDALEELGRRPPSNSILAYYYNCGYDENKEAILRSS